MRPAKIRITLKHGFAFSRCTQTGGACGCKLCALVYECALQDPRILPCEDAVGRVAMSAHIQYKSKGKQNA